MTNLAEKFVEPELALDSDEFMVEIRISSRENDCHTAYQTTLNHLNTVITSDLVPMVIIPMVAQLKRFIKEKLNAANQGKES